MTTCYIIVAGEGEYSDRAERPVRAYLDKEKAQAEMVKLDAIHNAYVAAMKVHWESYKDQPHYSYGTPERTAQDAAHNASYQSIQADFAARYLALGYEGFDGHDWMLSEAEFCQ